MHVQERMESIRIFRLRAVLDTMTRKSRDLTIMRGFSKGRMI